MSSLERSSSPVDWCESNYSISPVIAEFFNTMTNIIFLLVPPVLIHLFREYAKLYKPAVQVAWGLLMVVGLSSAYFHATLSLVGQLMDELSIFWSYAVCYVVFLPRKYFPLFLHNKRKVLAYYVSIATIVSTGVLLIHPAANAFALMLLFLPSFGYLYKELSITKCTRVYRLARRSVAIGILAISCWILDRMFCDAWLSINFPYMHGFWHILSFIATCGTIVLFAFVNVVDERPEQKPELKYWPRNDLDFGLPYVAIKYPYKKEWDLCI